jgi:hypothetical protein
MVSSANGSEAFGERMLTAADSTCRAVGARMYGAGNVARAPLMASSSAPLTLVSRS